MLDNKTVIVGYSGHAYVVAESYIANHGNISFYADLNEASKNPFDLSYLGLPTIGETGVLNFGDERFMYGNLNTWIGAKIFKTVFNLTVNGSYLTTTDNKTKNSATNLYFDEVGIYDNVGDLVIIGKFSTPIELPTGITVGLELTLDF